MIVAEELRFARGGRTILAGFAHRFRAGRSYAIIGPNGAGKSTLLTILAGQLRPDAGRVLLDGRPLDAFAVGERAGRIAWLPQNEAQDVPFTVGEYVALGAFMRRGSAAEEAAERLAAVGLPGFSGRRVADLSGGEFRLAAVARALAQETGAILVDEIDLGLDLANRARIAETLCRRAREEGRLLVAVVHDVNIASRHFDEILLLPRGGVLLAAGPPREVVTKRALDALYMADLFVQEDACGGAPLVAAASPADPRARPPATGRAVHVVCGGGTGGAAMAELVRAGARVSAGVLNIGDSDWRSALALGVDAVTDEPFRPVGEAARRENRARMAAADAVLLVGMPVGPGNLANLEDLLELARRAPGRVRLHAPDTFSDHADGRAAALFAELARLAPPIHRPAELA